MTPVEVGALIFTVLTAVVAMFAFVFPRKTAAQNMEWPYAVLGVKPGAPLALVKKSYREMVKRYHPDRLPSNSSPQVKKLFEERLIQLNSAYKTILALYNESSPEPRVSDADFQDVELMVRQLNELAENGGPPQVVIAQAYSVAEGLVKLLHRSAGLVRRENYYDMLTDLMMNDLLTIEQFNTLVEVRKLKNKAETAGFREASIAARSVRWVYVKLHEKYIMNADG
ncbi:MAG: J domain-containing protein [Candidatus Caldarchaeum sp.]|nr:J domain-containing protein [Candidatus Caldarchaeum sp.]MDW7977720.1 J domain-containing protein [Candidatus Caldarchaeum sp.]